MLALVARVGQNHIHIQGIFGREITKYMAGRSPNIWYKYGVCIHFTPTLLLLSLARTAALFLLCSLGCSLLPSPSPLTFPSPLQHSQNTFCARLSHVSGMETAPCCSPGPSLLPSPYPLTYPSPRTQPQGNFRLGVAATKCTMSRWVVHRISGIYACVCEFVRNLVCAA
jgi:hypothetical protein